MATADAVDSTNAEDISRKYKRLETNHKDWAAETEKDMRRLKAEISQLQKDNEQMRQQLRQTQGSPFGISRTQAANGQTLQPTGSTGSRIQKVREMEALRDQMAALEAKVGSEERKLEELAQKTEEIKAKIAQARRGMGGVNITKESTMMIQKQVKILEGRLEKAVTKFNDSLHANKELREQIDSLRQERSVFDNIYKKLERELQEKKKEMAFIIEVSNIAYEERDNALNELAQLKAFAAKEMRSFDETFKELDELLEEDRKMKESIKQRMAERKERTDARTTASAESLSKPKSTHLPNLKAAPMVTQSHSNVPQPGEMSAQNYEDAFNQIKEATNMADINLLVQKFMRSEDDNFSLFNYVNELNHQIEELEESRNQIRAELERVRQPSGNPHDQQRKLVLRRVEERVQAEEINGQRYADLADSTTATLETIMTCVDKIFTMLECDEQSIVDVQGIVGLSETSLHLYLAAIESKADEMLLRWRRIHGELDYSPVYNTRAGSFQIDMPTTGDDMNDANSDEDDHVLTREELIQRTQQKLMKQQLALEGRKGGKKATRKKPVGVALA